MSELHRRVIVALLIYFCGKLNFSSFLSLSIVDEGQSHTRTVVRVV